MVKISIAAGLVLAGGAAAQPAVVLNEIFVNAPGSDNGSEFIELKSLSPSMSLDGYALLVIEGDGEATGSVGTVDVVLSLDGMSTGANGLFLWRVLYPGDPGLDDSAAD